MAYEYTKDGTLHCPKKGAPADEISNFLDRVIDPLSSARIEYENELLIAKAYTESKQWNRVSKLKGNAQDYRRAPRITEPTRNDIPMPTDNVILEAVENEVARLAKRNSEVYVDASDASPAAKAGSKKATDVLMSHLTDIRWSRIRRRGIWRNVEYGTMILKSYLQLDNLETVKVPQKDVHRCSGQTVYPSPEEIEVGSALGEMPEPRHQNCGFMSVGLDVPAEKMGQLSPEAHMKLGADDSMTLPGLPDDINAKKMKYSLSECLDCGGPLEPYTPTGEELKGADFLGRPLGKDVPLGKAMIDCPSNYDVYFENEGVNVEPETMREIAQCTPRSLDWIKQYYRKNVDQVVPEDPTEIAETNPVWGEYGSASKGARGASDRQIYRNHCRVREYYKMPTVDYPLGRAIVMAGKVVLMDDDLMVPHEVEGQEPHYFPRVKYTLARCFPKDGELVGMGFPAHSISDQNRINMTLSQIVDTRERHGIDGIVATRGMKLTSPGWIKGHVGRVLLFEPDPASPGLKPERLDARLMDPGAWQEVEYCIGRVHARLGTNEVEGGNAPKGVSAYSAIAYLGEKASERRQQREKEIVDAFEEVFEHQLQLIQKYYREPRKYSVQIGQGQQGYERREFVGLDLHGETKAKVREQPSFDFKSAEREALANNLQQFPELLASPYGRREAAKVLGLPVPVMDQSNVQLDAASRKWFNFLRDRKIPVVDQNLDNHQIHFSEYGRLLMSSEGVDLAEKVQFDAVLKMINGWQQVLMPPAPPPMPGPPGPDGMPLMIQPPPLPPPVDPTLPLQDQIMMVWGQMLAQKGMPTLDPELQAFMAFRAVFEAHRMIAEGTMMAGGPQLPAPGSASPGPSPRPDSPPAIPPPLPLPQGLAA